MQTTNSMQPIDIFQCDEIRPCCGPCIKRELACHFQANPAYDNGQSLSPGGYSEQFRDKPHGPLPARVLELKLLHHFTSVIYLTFIPKNEAHAHCWQVHVPDLAMEHTFLLDGVMAISALHLAYLETGTRKLWLQSALRYQDLTLAGLNRALSNIGSENCEAVAICSIFVLLLNIAMPGICDDTSETSRNPITDLLGLRKLLEGIALIITQSEVVLSNGVLKDFFLPLYQPKNEHSISPDSREGGTEQLVVPNHSLRVAAHMPTGFFLWTVVNCAGMFIVTCLMKVKLIRTRSIAESLQRLQVLIRNRADHQVDYWGAYQSLEKTIMPFHSVGNVISWPLAISPAIFSLLEQNDTLACLLFVHYGMVLHLLSNWWFTRDAGKRLIRALLPYCSAVDKSWRDTIEWAKRSVGIVD